MRFNIFHCHMMERFKGIQSYQVLPKGKLNLTERLRPYFFLFSCLLPLYLKGYSICFVEFIKFRYTPLFVSVIIAHGLPQIILIMLFSMVVSILAFHIRYLKQKSDTVER